MELTPEQVKQQIDERLCCLIFMRVITEDGMKELSNLLKNQYAKSSPNHLPYDLFSKKIYEMNDEQSSDVLKIVTEKKDILLGDSEVAQTYNSVIMNVSLALNQKDYINRTLIKLEKNISTAEKEVETVQDIKNKIYSDFITILGIFTAISFTIFGGFELLGNIFGNVKLKPKSNLGATLLLGSIYLVGIYALLLVLFNGISKLTGKEKYSVSTKLARGILIPAVLISIVSVLIFMFC